jgi:hypothetical protein
MNWLLQLKQKIILFDVHSWPVFLFELLYVTIFHFYRLVHYRLIPYGHFEYTTYYLSWLFIDQREVFASLLYYLLIYLRNRSVHVSQVSPLDTQVSEFSPSVRSHLANTLLDCDSTILGCRSVLGTWHYAQHLYDRISEYATQFV